MVVLYSFAAPLSFLQLLSGKFFGGFVQLYDFFCPGLENMAPLLIRFCPGLDTDAFEPMRGKYVAEPDAPYVLNTDEVVFNNLRRRRDSWLDMMVGRRRGGQQRGVLLDGCKNETC